MILYCTKYSQHMLRIIKDPSRILSLEKEFNKRLRDTTHIEKIRINVGWQGGNYQEIAYYSRSFDFWWSQDLLKKRTWNIFSIGRPMAPPAVNAISCEINFAFKDVNRRVSGAFAEDAQGNIIVVHRGRIGGGRKGIGKERFWRNYLGTIDTLFDGNVGEQVAIVGSFKSKDFARNVSDFVHAVHKIKENTIGKGSPISRQKSVFKPEFAGQKEYDLPQDKITASADHGRVVNTLHTTISKFNKNVTNTRPIDLFVTDGQDKVTVIFEVKTDSETTSVYCAIGQLMYHSSTLKQEPKLVAVFPQDIPAKTIRNLNALGITTILYGWKGDNVLFNEDEIRDLVR